MLRVTMTDQKDKSFSMRIKPRLLLVTPLPRGVEGYFTDAVDANHSIRFREFVSGSLDMRGHKEGMFEYSLKERVTIEDASDHASRAVLEGTGHVKVEVGVPELAFDVKLQLQLERIIDLKDGTVLCKGIIRNTSGPSVRIDRFVLRKAIRRVTMTDQKDKSFSMQIKQSQLIPSLPGGGKAYFTDAVAASHSIGFREFVLGSLDMHGHKEGMFEYSLKSEVDVWNACDDVSRALLEGTGHVKVEVAVTLRRHTVKPGETLSEIAKTYYGSAARWPEIYNANRDEIKTPNVLACGIEIVIP
ncbi:MAG: LysM peptidoglycan-binding domain-containing protein [Puniceicoccales bacterium]|jgi:LysM repeat protein|nr:LysM peptidoglycan-binding domain-containing protein [Puniceicoccales bacterium]